MTVHWSFSVSHQKAGHDSAELQKMAWAPGKVTFVLPCEKRRAVLN
jgi:hypothetical protein